MWMWIRNNGATKNWPFRQRGGCRNIYCPLTVKARSHVTVYCHGGIVDSSRENGQHSTDMLTFEKARLNDSRNQIKWNIKILYQVY